MKICWDELEKVKYNKDYGFYRERKRPDKNYIEKQKVYYIENCEVCNEPFLSVQSKSKTCSRKCLDICKSYNENRSKSLLGKVRTPETIEKLRISHLGKMKGVLNSRWRYGGTYTWFSTYSVKLTQLQVENRPSQNDENILEVKCKFCGEWYKPLMKDVSAHIVTNGIKSYLYCSDKCKSSCSIFGQRLFPKDYINPNVGRDLEVQKELREMRLEIDNYECQICGSKKDLQCHHYEGIKYNPIESADVDACITLCSSCHINKSHSQKGCRPNDLICRR